jgi:uncharacterized phiE125 gp8 family phage protein
MAFRLQVASGPNLTPSGNTGSGIAQVTSMSSTAGILVGSLVLCSGYVPPDTLVASVDSSTQITLTNATTAAGTGVTLSVSNEPITLAQAKAHCRITFADDDPYFASLIIAARRCIETEGSQHLIATTLDYWSDNWPWLGGYYNRVVRAQAVMGPMPYYLPNSNTGVLQLHGMPLLSVSYVKYKDFTGTYQTVSSSQYIFDAVTPGSTLVGPSRIQPQYGLTWPVPEPVIDSVNIRYVCGYGTDYTGVPENLKHAMKLLVAYWYANREHVVVGLVPSRLQDTIDSLIAASDPGSYS